METLKIDHFAAFFDRVTECEIDAQDADDRLLELFVGVFNELECLSKFVACVEDATGKNQEVCNEEVLELAVLCHILHEWSAGIVAQDDAALEPPLVDEEHAIFEIGLELAVWD